MVIFYILILYTVFRTVFGGRGVVRRVVSEEKKKEILKCYEHESADKIARRLGLSKANVIKIANRACVTKRLQVNKIVDNKKLCPSCHKMLTLNHFTKDKYQPNNISYLCKECRLKKLKDKAEAPKVIEHKNTNNGMAFGIRKNRNPIIIKDGVRYLKCKVCNKVKPLDAYYKAPGNTNGCKNTCIKCIKKKRHGLI